VLFLFYNFLLFNFAAVTGNENLCSLSFNNVLFNSEYPGEEIKNTCIAGVATKEGDTSVCDKIRGSAKESCYGHIARSEIRESRDIKKAFDENMEIVHWTMLSEMEPEIREILSNPNHPDIVYAVKAAHFVMDAEEYIPILKNVVAKSNSLDAKKASLDVIIDRLHGYDQEEEKIILKNEILPLVENNPELKEYEDEIDKRMNLVWS